MIKSRHDARVIRYEVTGLSAAEAVALLGLWKTRAAVELRNFIHEIDIPGLGLGVIYYCNRIAKKLSGKPGGDIPAAQLQAHEYEEGNLIIKHESLNGDTSIMAHRHINCPPDERWNVNFRLEYWRGIDGEWMGSSLAIDGIERLVIEALEEVRR